MNFTRLTFTLLILFCCNLSYAQYNDTTHYRLTLAASGSINKTNDAQAYLLNNSLNFGINQKNVMLSSTNTWVYGQQNSVRTNNDFSSILFFDINKAHRFYYWGLANYNTSYSLKINNQWLAGGGIAYRILDDKDAHLSISDGILFDQSSLLASLNYNTFRNSLRVQFHFTVKDIVTFDGSNFLQNSLSNSNDYIIRSTTTMGLKLRKWISLTTALTYNDMQITNSSNLVFTYGITMDKFF
jgi:hypothetical protein